MYKLKNSICVFFGFNDSYLYLVQAQRQGQEQAKIINFYSKNIAGLKDDELSRILAFEIKRQNLQRKPLIAVVERKNVFLKQMVFPSASPEELRKMAELQILQYLPDTDDLCWDYLSLSKDTGHSRVLCLAASNTAVERYIKILSQAHIHPVKLTVSSLGILRLFLNNKDLKTSIPSILIYLNHTSMEILFVQKKELYFSRHIPFGAIHLKDEKNDSLDQIHLTILSFLKEKMGDEFEQFVLFSSEEQTEVLKEALESYKMPIEILAPSALLPRIDKPGSLPELDSLQLAMFGLGLSNVDRLPNLLPLHLKDRKILNQKKTVFWKFIFLGILTLILGITALNVQGYKDSLQLKQTQDRLVQIRIQVKEAEERSRRLNILKQNLDQRVLTLDVIKELYALTPSKVFYDAVELARDGRIILEGQTQTASSVNRLQQALLGSTIFSDVNLDYAARRPSPLGESTHFRITCRKARR